MSECIAVIADIHANVWALDAVLADIDRRGITTVVNLGDSLAGALDPAATAARLLPRAFLTVAGNNDHDILDPAASPGSSAAFARARLSATHLDWLRALPATAVLEPDLFLCHGTPAANTVYLLEAVDATGAHLRDTTAIAADLAGVTQPVVLCGHSHLPRVVSLPGGTLIVNPGSVGVPAYADDLPFPHRMEAGSPHARYAILTRHTAGWTVEQVALPYPWDKAAAAGQAHGRADYVGPILTGRV